MARKTLGNPKASRDNPNFVPMASADFWKQVAAKKSGSISDEMRAFAKSQLKGQKGRK